MNGYGITPEQYHAGLDKLWGALNGDENGVDDVFTMCADKIKELQLELGLMTVSRDGLKDRLESCEKALEDRDAK